MIAVGGVGKGLSGCMRYVMGEGNDPGTHKRRPAAANDDASRVAWIGGQGWREGWTPQTREDVELARRRMEAAAHRHTQNSPTRACEKDCLHLVLSWRTGENPSRAEMEEAAREALAAVGMETARAVFVAHRDTKHAHLHIVASRINPETGRAFRDSYSHFKWQKWALEWERRHGLAQCPAREKRSQIMAAVEERNAAAVLDLMTQRQATFTGKELDRELGRVLGKEEAAGFKAELLGQADVLVLHDRDSGARLDRFTTRGVREAEAKALDHAAALAADRRHQVGKKAAAAALATRPTMREEQRRAFDHATAAGGLAIIDGKAGTGKSYTMGAIRDAYEGDGKRVIGLAPTNAVAQDMQRDGFKEAKTIHAALFALKNDRDRWDRKTVIMVDEAAMVGTKIMGELLAQARAAGAKLILVGDDRQLASIERGGLFAELRQRFGAAELADVTRQRQADHKEAAEMLARGEFAEAVAALDKLGCITRNNHQTESMAALVEQWKADTATAPGKSRLVFAYTNDDVKQLNAALRAVRRERGELGEDCAFTTKDGKAAFAKHDRVVFTTSDKRKGIINGAMGTIERIEDQKITLRMDGKSARLLTFDAAEMPSFRHAYAGTIYKGQGRTFDDVYLYHSQHWKDAAAYVALTRHRDDVKLFVSTEVTRDTADLARQLARHDDRRASLAFATAEEVQQQRRDQHQRAAEEVTGHKAAPYREPPPPAPAKTPEAADRRDDRQARYDRTAPPESPPPQQQPESTAAPIRAAFERLAQFVAEMLGMDPTPARPTERAREVRATVRGAAEPAPTAHVAPLPDAATGWRTEAVLDGRRAVAQGKATAAPNPPPAQEGKAMPILEALLASTVAPDILEDTATIIRESVGDMAKAAGAPPAPRAQPDRDQAPAPTPTPAAGPEKEPEQAAAPKRKETPAERAERLKNLSSSIIRENAKDKGNDREGGRSR